MSVLMCAVGLVPPGAQWPTVTQMPEYPQLSRLDRYPDTLQEWYAHKCRTMQAPMAPAMGGPAQPQQDGQAAQAGYSLLRQLLAYDPGRRITARASLTHQWWAAEPRPHAK